MIRQAITLFDVETAQCVSAGRVHPNAAWAMSSHAHPYWEFVYFVSGSGRVDVPSARFSPQAYHLVAYPPGLPHAEAANPFDPEETIFIGIRVDGEAPPGAHLILPDPSGELGWLCERIVRERASSGITPLMHTYARAFLYLVDRLWASGVPVQHDPVDASVQYLHANYAQDISLESIAKVVCLSKTHLAHRFSAKLGISPLKYLQHIRIEIAKRLLATTSQPVSEIAVQVGFRDPLYFSRALKAATGLSPKAYREQATCASQSISTTISSIPNAEESGV